MRTDEEDEEGLEMVELGERVHGDADGNGSEEEEAFLSANRKRRSLPPKRSFWPALLASPVKGSPAVRAAWASVPLSIAFLVLVCLARPLLPHPEPLKDVHAIGPDWNLSVSLHSEPLSLIELDITTPALQDHEEGSHPHFHHPGKPFEKLASRTGFGVGIELAQAGVGRIAGPFNRTISPEQKENVLSIKPAEFDLHDDGELQVHVNAQWDESYYLPIEIGLHQYVSLFLHCVENVIQLSLSET